MRSLVRSAGRPVCHEGLIPHRLCTLLLAISFLSVILLVEDLPVFHHAPAPLPVDIQVTARFLPALHLTISPVHPRAFEIFVIIRTTTTL